MEWPGSDLDLIPLRDSERTNAPICSLFYQPLFRKENVGKCPFKELLLCAHSIPILLLLNQPPPSRFLESHSCIRDTLNTKDLGIFTFFRKVIRPSHEDRVGKSWICPILVFLKRERSEVTSSFFLLPGQEWMQRQRPSSYNRRFDQRVQLAKPHLLL